MRYKTKDKGYVNAIKITKELVMGIGFDDLKDLTRGGVEAKMPEGGTTRLHTEIYVGTFSGKVLAPIGSYVVRTPKSGVSVVDGFLFEEMFEEAPPKKKAMLSQPMRGLTDEQIVATRNRAIDYLESHGYEVVNTLFTDEWYNKDSMEDRGVKQIPICFLAKSIENMSLCDAAFFCVGWENTRGCVIEHEVAEKYGLTIIHESDIIEGDTIKEEGNNG